MPREITPANEVLYRARYNAGWTQQKLADIVGVSRQTVNGYERGTARPSPETAERVAKVLSAATGDRYRVTDLFDLPLKRDAA